MANNLLERLRLPLVLTACQTMFAGFMILSRLAVDNGVNVLVFNFYRSAIAMVLLFPAAACVERKTRPPMNRRILFRIFILALFGLTAAQTCFLLGIVLTSASFGATFQNVVPVFTFIVALLMGVEEIHLKRRDGWAKMTGTVLCMLGAMTMSMYQGPTLVGMPGFLGGEYGLSDMELTRHGGTFTHAMEYLRSLGLNEWQLGTGILVVGYVMWSLYLTLQVPVLEEYPAPLTITAITYCFASVQFLVVAIFTHGTSKSAWTVPWGLPLLSVLYAGVVISCVTYTLQTWCIKRGGPLLAAAFMPVQCVVALALAVAFLGDKLFLGSCVGGMVIVLGLYLVVWGRTEAQHFRRFVESADLEKALSRIQSFSGGLTTPFLQNVDPVKAPSTPNERDEVRDH